MLFIFYTFSTLSILKTQISPSSMLPVKTRFETSSNHNPRIPNLLIVSNLIFTSGAFLKINKGQSLQENN